MPAESVISADSHIQEPPELFSERLPKEFRHLAPWVEEREDGARYLHVEGKRPRRVDIAEARESEDDQHREFRNDPTGGRDIERRIEDQEVDGAVPRSSTRTPHCIFTKRRIRSFSLPRRELTTIG